MKIPNPMQILQNAQKNRPEEIRRLVAAGVDVNFANPGDRIQARLMNAQLTLRCCVAVGQTALHVAMLWGHYEACVALLEANADLNQTNIITGGTPLHMAAGSPKNPAGRW